MRRYTIGRLLAAIPTALGVATLVFMLIHIMPGDPVEVMLGESSRPTDRVALRAHLGLDRPLAQQYATFLAGLARGSLGQSLHSQRDVTTILAEHAPATAQLALAALAMALALAIPAGLLSAYKPGSLTDRLCLSLSLGGVAVPNFWLGPMLIMVFSISLGWLPVSGRGSPAHLLLPAFTLGAGMAGILTRMTRTTVLEALGQDYIRTARCKGASELSVVSKHALKNALTPLISVVGLQLGSVLAGSVITETVFAWPGIGRLLVHAINTRDYPVVQGCVLLIAVTYLVVNLVADLAYAWANPRIRYAVQNDED